MKYLVTTKNKAHEIESPAPLTRTRLAQLVIDAEGFEGNYIEELTKCENSMAIKIIEGANNKPKSAKTKGVL